MTETPKEMPAVVTGPRPKVSTTALTWMTATIAVMLAGILAILIAIYLRIEDDLTLLKDDVSQVVDDVAAQKRDVSQVVGDVADAVELLRPVSSNAAADLADCGPGAARNTRGECIIG